MRTTVRTAFLWSLAIMAAAQSGIEISMPPNSRQRGELTFANRCPTPETFQIGARPPVPWLSLDPTVVDVDPATSFAVQVTIRTSDDPKPGAKTTSVVAVCASCAVSQPPCFQSIQGAPLHLTVSGTGEPARFEIAAPPPAPSVAETLLHAGGVSPAKEEETRKSPGVAETPPVPAAIAQDKSATPLPAPLPPDSLPTSRRLIPLAGGGVLAAGLVGAFLAAKEKLALRRARW